MKELIPILGADGEEILFESSTEAVVGAIIRGQETLAEALPVESLAEIGGKLQRQSAELIRGFTEQQPSPLLPAEVEIEFGVKLEGKGRLIFVEGGAEAHLRVKLKWVFKPS